MKLKNKVYRGLLPVVSSFSLLLQTLSPIFAVLPNYSYAQEVAPAGITETVAPTNQQVIGPTINSGIIIK